MRLTDEEKAIADEVARHWAYTLEKLDAAFARALERAREHIAERLAAFGESTAATDRDLPVWDADGEEIPPEGVAAMYRDLHRPALALCAHFRGVSLLTFGELASMWEQLCDAVGLPPGTATAAGDAAPRGVVVTEAQRKAVVDAYFRGNLAPDTFKQLACLLDAIDAAKGGGE